MISALREINRYLHFLTGGGSWRLLPHEEAILDACLAALPQGAQEPARRQLKEKFFLERMTDGRINVVRPYGDADANIINSAGFDDRLYRVKIKVDGEAVTAHVTFNKGRVFSIETKKQTKFFKGKSLEVLGVIEGRSSDTFTRVIDRSEHGRENEFDE